MDRYLPPLSEKAARWARFGGVLAALALLAWIVADLQTILTPIAVAAVIAYIFNPVITWLERRGVARLYAIAGLYVIGTVLVLALGFYLVVHTFDQVGQLRQNIGGYVEVAKEWLAARSALAAGTTQPGEAAAIDWWSEVGPLVEKHGIAVANYTLDLLTGFFTSALNWISVFVLIPVFGFFFLWKFNDLVRTIRDHLPAKSRDAIVYLVTTIDQSVANFFRGRLIVSLIVGLVTGIGWTLVGVPYALPLGALAGVLNLVPFMSLLALPPALIICYFDAVSADEPWAWPVLLTMGVYLLAQALETFVLTPTIESKSSGLHPLTTVVALLIGAQWAGLLGMLLAIPIASTLKTLAAELLLPELRRLAERPAAESSEPPGAGAEPAGPPAASPGSAPDGTQDPKDRPAP